LIAVKPSEAQGYRVETIYSCWTFLLHCADGVHDVFSAEIDFALGCPPTDVKDHEPQTAWKRKQFPGSNRIRGICEIDDTAMSGVIVEV
jgi:hypothetical protein